MQPKSLQFITGLNIINNKQLYNQVSKLIINIILKLIFDYDNKKHKDSWEYIMSVAEDRGLYGFCDGIGECYLDNKNTIAFLKYCLNKFDNIKIPMLYRRFGKIDYISRIGPNMTNKLLESKFNFILNEYPHIALRPLNEEYYKLTILKQTWDDDDFVGLDYINVNFPINKNIIIRKAKGRLDNLLIQIDKKYYVATLWGHMYIRELTKSSTINKYKRINQKVLFKYFP